MMPQPSPGIRRPRTDDRPLWDILEGILGYQAVVVAHDLGLFRVIADRPRLKSEICDTLKLAARPAEALLVACTSLGLLRLQNGYYSLTPLAEDYLLEHSPTYYGEIFNFARNQNQAVYANLKKAFLTNTSVIRGRQELFKPHEQFPALARAFTHFMHSHSIAPALAWPEALDLSESRLMLDVGGGSGAHAIGAVRAWPHLRSLILEIGPVCEAANEYVRRYGLQARIGTHQADMWADPFPPADLHFYSDIYHDWPPERCRFLTKKSFDSLEPGGRIVIHEVLYNDDKTGPLAAAGYAIAMLLWTEGQQFSGRELATMLSETGFADVEVKTTFGYWSIVTGRKPA